MSEGEKNEGSKKEVANEWVNLTPDCLITVFSKLTVEEMLEGPIHQVCKTWRKSGKDSTLYNHFDFGSRTVQLDASQEFDWEAMELKMDNLLHRFVDRSNGGMKSVKIKLCTDRAISDVADRCPNLEILWLTSCPNVTDTSMTKIATKCNKLKELRIRSSFQITQKALDLVKLNCPEVKIL